MCVLRHTHTSCRHSRCASPLKPLPPPRTEAGLFEELVLAVVGLLSPSLRDRSAGETICTHVHRLPRRNSLLLQGPRSVSIKVSTDWMRPTHTWGLICFTPKLLIEMLISYKTHLHRNRQNSAGPPGPSQADTNTNHRRLPPRSGRLTLASVSHGRLSLPPSPCPWSCSLPASGLPSRVIS